MLMMLLQTSPSILEQLGGRAALIQKELERREKVQQMNVRLSFSVLTFFTSFSNYFRSRWILIQCYLSCKGLFHINPQLFLTDMSVLVFLSVL